MGALERCLGAPGWSSGVPGMLLGDPQGLFGSSWALPRGSWNVFWGSVVPVEPKRFWGPLLGAPGKHVCCRKGNGRQSRKQSNMIARRPKRTILGTSSWGSWQPCLLSKGQRATEQRTGEHDCQETETDDSGDLLLGLLATMFTVEKRSAPGGPQRDAPRVRSFIWGPLFPI